MSYVNIGSLSMQVEWLSVAVALITASLLFRLIMKKKTGDWHWNAFFAYIVVWKGSYIFFHFGLFLQNPLSVLFFSGGIKGHTLGIITVIVYLFLQLKKNSLFPDLPILFSLFFFIYEAFMIYLEGDPVHLLAQILFTLSFIIYLQLRKPEGYKEFKQVFLLFQMMQILIISIFGTIISVDLYSCAGIALFILFSYKREVCRN
ncbi:MULTISPECIES: hypothetical protein [Bacillaceae]|uniref:hypothetical protein n=1 Tax=Bacillaceae TaxID=186817 RepID=UPI0011586402|nr:MULTISPECIES: hypothetical protein [Bacillus]MCP1161122.1 hypothetical protein [Bacillus infantis]MDW2879628.1 hypothetical protein [Bacillus infantis]